MKVQIKEAKTLKKAIQQILNIIPINPTLPILRNILLKATKNLLSIEGTDMDISVQTKIECDVKEDGEITVDARELMRIFQKGKELYKLSIFADDENIKINLDKSKTEFKGGSAADFPFLKYSDKGVEINLSGTDFVEMVNKAGFSVSQDRTRLVLTGIYWKVSSDEMVMVSTDGHRLSLFGKKIKTDIEKTIEMVVLPKTLQLAVKLVSGGLDLKKVIFNEKTIFFDFGTTKIFSKLIEGDYPNFRQVIPENNSKNIYMKRKEFLTVLQGVLPLSDSVNHKIFLKIVPNLMEIEVINEDTGTKSLESINICYDNEPINIAFNCIFLTEILKKIETDDVLLKLESPMDACVIKPVEKPKLSFPILGSENETECLYLIMPLRE